MQVCKPLLQLQGEDMREGNSPSWFNPVETVEVVKYVQQVLSLPNNDLTTSDIGIITPYRKQVSVCFGHS